MPFTMKSKDKLASTTARSTAEREKTSDTREPAAPAVNAAAKKRSSAAKKLPVERYFQYQEYLVAQPVTKEHQNTMWIRRDAWEKFMELCGGDSRVFHYTIRRLMADFAVMYLGEPEELIEKPGSEFGEMVAVIHPFIKSIPANWRDESERIREDLYCTNNKQVKNISRTGKAVRKVPDDIAKYVGITSYPFVHINIRDKGTTTYSLLVRYLVHKFLEWLEA